MLGCWDKECRDAIFNCEGRFKKIIERQRNKVSGIAILSSEIYYSIFS